MKKESRIILVMISAAWLLVFSSSVSAEVLAVKEIFQEQTSWCWAACSEAVIEYYGSAINQCTIADWAREQNEWGEADCCLPEDAIDPICNHSNSMFMVPGSLRNILIHWGVDNYPHYDYIIVHEIDSLIHGHMAFVIRWAWDTGGGHFLVGRGIDDMTVHYMDPLPGYGYSSGDYYWVVMGGNHQWTHTITVSNYETIPTLSEWGLIVFSLLILTLITVAATRRRIAASVAGETVDIATNAPLFVSRLFLQTLTVTLGLAAAVLTVAIILSQDIPLRDIGGTILSAAFVAYMAHLWIIRAQR